MYNSLTIKILKNLKNIKNKKEKKKINESLL